MVTQSIGGSRDLSQITKPDWQHTTSYTRLGQKVIEMPFDPGAKLNLTLKTNKWVFNKAYSRSYYLLINDNSKYQAYILTIIADSSYVKNDLTKLTHNSYRRLDADFSGLVLYYTPKGDYIGGYGYKDGHLVQPETTTQSDSKKIQSVDMGALKPNTMVADCVDWYQQTTIYYEDGHVVIFDWVYLDTRCTYRDDGTTPGGGNPPPATPPALPPPPPPCPTGTGGASSPCAPPLNVEGLKTNNIPPPTDPGDGGAAPPPAQTPCTVTVTPCPADDPCAKKADIIARAVNSIIAAQNTSILTNTTAHGSEYGANQNLTSLTGSTYVNTPVTTNGASNAWTIGFNWDNNGYTVGFSHGHPDGYGPSPADVYTFFANKSPVSTQEQRRQQTGL